MLYIFIMVVEILLSYKKCPKIQVWSKLGQVSVKKFLCSDNPGQNIWHKLKKYSKIGKDHKSLISKFAFFLITFLKILFLEGILGTGLCLHPNLTFLNISRFPKILSHKSIGNSWGNKFVILDIKCRFTCCDSDLY